MKIQRIQKFQVGGSFAAYTVPYIPISAQTTAGAYDPGPTTRDAASSRGSKSSENELSMKDILKVFDDVKGLPIDVNYVLKDFQQMFTNDILLSVDGKPSYSSLVNYYLSNLGKFNQLRESKEQYDKVREELIKNNSLDEIAVNSRGNIIVQTEDGIDAISLKEFKENPDSFRPLTNHELLELRQKNLPFGDSIYSSMTGVGMDTIVRKINSIVQNLGSSDKKLEGYTVKQSNDIRSGLTAMQEAAGVEGSTMTIDGLYKNSILTKDQKGQAQLAMQAVYNSLTPQEKTLLGLHSSDTIDTLSNIVLSRTSNKFEFNPTFQAELNIDGSKKTTESDDKEKENPLTLMQKQQGGVSRQLNLVNKERNTQLNINSTHYPIIPKVEGDTSIENMLYQSNIAGILQNFNSITFGDIRVPKESLKDIMYAQGGGDVAILPVTIDPQGNKIVDLSIIKEYEKAVSQVKAEKGTEAWYKELAPKLKEAGLDELMGYDGNVNKDRFGLFLVVEGYTTDKVLKTNPNFEESEFIEKAADTNKDLETRIIKALSTNKDKDNYILDVDDKWGFLELGYDDVYRGNVYIPLNNNKNAAMIAWGQQIGTSSSHQYEKDYQIWQSGKVDNMQSTSSDVLE